LRSKRNTKIPVSNNATLSIVTISRRYRRMIRQQSASPIPSLIMVGAGPGDKNAVDGTDDDAWIGRGVKYGVISDTTISAFRLSQARI
jgi:hypothetical protein